MSELAVAAAWAVVVAGVGWRRRPAPARVRALGRERTAPKLVGPSRRPPVERLGCWLLGRMGRPPDPLTGRRVGGAVLAAAAVVPVLPFAVPAAALLGWSLPVVRARRAERRRLAALASDLPEVVDLFVLGVGAGLPPRPRGVFFPVAAKTAAVRRARAVVWVRALPRWPRGRQARTVRAQRRRRDQLSRKERRPRTLSTTTEERWTCSPSSTTRLPIW